jgi:hypothetical protein
MTVAISPVLKFIVSILSIHKTTGRYSSSSSDHRSSSLGNGTDRCERDLKEEKKENGNACAPAEYRSLSLSHARSPRPPFGLLPSHVRHFLKTIQLWTKRGTPPKGAWYSPPATVPPAMRGLVNLTDFD